MRTFWKLIKDGWDIAPRLVLVRRRGPEAEFAAVVRRGGKVAVEAAGSAEAVALRRHPVFRRALSFPRLLATRFIAAMPLEKGIPVEWTSPLSDPKRVRRVLPFEMQGQLPFPAGALRFAAVAGTRANGSTRWHAVGLPLDDLREELDFWSGCGIELDALDWEGNVWAQAVCAASSGRPEAAWAAWPRPDKAVFFAAARGGTLLSQKRADDPRIPLFSLQEKGEAGGAREFAIEADWGRLAASYFGKTAARLNFLEFSDRWRAGLKACQVKLHACRS